MAHVILIDDDPLFANLVRSRLREAGHEVSYNEGAFGALTAVRKARPDLILIDVQMPEIEGPKLVNYLRGRDDDAACILLMSSIPESKLRATATSYGADGYVCKGWGVVQIASRVENELSNRQTQLQRRHR